MPTLWQVFSNTQSNQFLKGHYKSQQEGLTLLHSVALFYTDLSNNLYNLNTLRIFFCCMVKSQLVSLCCPPRDEHAWPSVQVSLGTLKNQNFPLGQKQELGEWWPVCFSVLIKAGMSAMETFSTLVVGWIIAPGEDIHTLCLKPVNVWCYMAKGT